MSDASSENEPTMEEILASIRKIISEDESDGDAAAEPDDSVEDQAPAGEDQAPAGEDQGSAGEEDPEPLELTQMVEDDGSVVDLRAEHAPADEGEPEPAEPEQEAAPVPEELTELAGDAEAPPAEEIELDAEDADDDAAPAEDIPLETPPAGDARDLVSAVTAAAATASLSQLTERLDDGAASGSPGSIADKTLEALVRETLTPHLKAWLDGNLPDLVERIVREEIKKMVKRAEYR